MLSTDHVGFLHDADGDIDLSTGRLQLAAGLAGAKQGVDARIRLVRGERESAIAAMDVCRKRLEQKVSVMIFPEGTRSLTDEIGPFKDGAFHLAIASGADILPLAVHGTASALPVHDWRFGRARARVIVGDPISTAGMSPEDVPHLKAIVRAEIEALRARLRAQLA